MTISVGSAGQYAAAQGMWVGQGGQWVEVPLGGGAFQADIEFVGVPSNGQIDVTTVPNATVELYAGKFVDTELPTSLVATKAADAAGSATFTPADFLSEEFTSYVHPATGWRAASYYVRCFSGDAAGASVDIFVEGEGRWRNDLAYNGNIYVHYLIDTFVPRLVSENNAGGVGMLPSAAPVLYTNTTDSLFKNEGVALASVKYDFSRLPVETGWLLTPPTHIYVDPLTGSSPSATWTTTNFFVCNSLPIEGVTTPYEDSPPLMSDVSKGTHPIVAADWEQPFGIIGHIGAANTYTRDALDSYQGVDSRETLFIVESVPRA